MSSKVVLVTGCSAGGIGAAIALSLAKLGHHIFATARSPVKIPKELSERTNVTILPLDVTSPSSVTDAVIAVKETGKGLDVLVNNAGAGYAMPVLDIEIEKAQELYETNVWGCVRTIQAFADLLIASRGGRIVNVSTCGAVVNAPWISTYASSKAALTNISETLRLELQPFGVTVVTLMAGTIQSQFHANDSFALPSSSRYVPIENVIAGWANGESLPKNACSAEEFAEMITTYVVGNQKGGVVYKGPNAGSMYNLSKWAPGFIADAGMTQNQGIHELSRIVETKK